MKNVHSVCLYHNMYIVLDEVLNVLCGEIILIQSRGLINSKYEVLNSLFLLALKVPRKTTSENVICLCCLLHLFANFSNILFAYRQTVWTQI